MSRGTHSAARSGCGAQRGDRGEGHRDRAAEARLGLARAHVGGRARDVGARLVGAPRQRVQLLLHPGAHERVPRGVELDLVAAVAEAIVGVQHGRVLVGLDAPAHRLAAPERARGAQALARPSAALALERLLQRGVVLEQVAALQRRDLVEDLVGRGRRREHQWVSSVTERRQKVTRSATSASASTSSATGDRGPTSASPSAPTSAAAVSSTFWRRQLAGVDALAQDLGEAGGVGPAEGQALDLDGRIDGLGQQRPGQAPAAQRPPREGLHRGGEPAGGRAARRRGGGARGIDLALRRAPEDLREELGLGREVAVHAAGGDPGARGDRGHLRLAVAAAGDQRVGGAHDPLAGGRAAGLGALGRAVRHARSEPQFTAWCRGRPAAPCRRPLPRG